MEQLKQRFNFVKTGFNDVYDEFVANDDLFNEILNEIDQDQNNPCKELMPVLKKLNNREAQKCFLIWLYINERSPSQYLSDLLRKHKKDGLAQKFENFNKTEKFIEYSTDEYLKVAHSTLLKSGGSCRFQMETLPRGLFLIILNEKELLPEAKQFINIFNQMYFTVKFETQNTCKQIDQILEEVATHDKYKEFNALITLFIGHGSTGLFYGSNIDKDPNDNIPITHLIDKFSEEKLVNFRGKPKVNIFNCCRHRTSDQILDLSKINSTLLEKITTFKKDWVNKNINTTIIYSCAEGQRSFYSDYKGFSYFGIAMSHTLAQFACEKNLDELMKTVNKRLARDDVGQFPEVIQYKSTWELHFNPGQFKVKSMSKETDD